MDQVTAHIVWTVFMFVAFVALVVWLLGSGRNKAFDEAARIPLQEDEYEPGNAEPTVPRAAEATDKEEQT